MNGRSFRLTIFLLCLLAWFVRAESQQIRGTVTDPSGAVVAGAAVSLWSNGQMVASGETDAQGNYSIHPAEGACATCRLTCSAQGFATAAQQITLRPGQELILPIRLAIEAVAENIKVEVKSEPFRDQLDVGTVRESSAKDLGEALTQLDGVYKIRRAGIANDLVVRGFQQNNVNVLIDGARIYGACPGHMDPAVHHVDFAEVERVDIGMGAFDVTHSSSLGATVQVVTKTPPLGFHFTPSIAFGSFGFYNPSATASFGNEKLRMLLGYSYRVSDPYKDGSGTSFLNLKNGNYNDAAQNQHAFDIHTGWLEAAFSPAANQKLTLGYTRQESGLVLYPYQTMDSDYDNADRASLKYEIHDVGGGIGALRLQSYFTQVIHFMSDRYRTSAMMGSWMMAADARSRAIGGRVEADAGRDFTFGLESYYRNWNMMGYMNMGAISSNPTLPDVGTSALGVFADYHHAITDRFKLTAGLRFDHDSMAANTANLNTDAYYHYQGTRSTSMSDNYGSGNVRLSYTLRKQVEIFAGMGTAGRVPDAEERYINRPSMTAVNVGNPTLPIVRNTESTAGLIFRHSSSYLKSTLFYSRLDDYILVNNQPQVNMVMGQPMPARSYTNVAARMYGGELSYALSLPSGFSLNGGGCYSKGTNDRKPEAGVFSTNLPEMPPLRTWAALRYVHKSAFLELGGTAVARQSLVDKDLNETPTAGYGLMNAKLGLTYHKLYAGLIVDNLLDRYYYEHLSYYRDPFSAGIKVPEPGRSFFAQVKFSF